MDFNGFPHTGGNFDEKKRARHCKPPIKGNGSELQLSLRLREGRYILLMKFHILLGVYAVDFCTSDGNSSSAGVAFYRIRQKLSDSPFIQNVPSALYLCTAVDELGVQKNGGVVASRIEDANPKVETRLLHACGCSVTSRGELWRES